MTFPLAECECWYLTGPTASGKSAVSLALAERLRAEIVSLDSMALYRGLDIGTAKPTAAERQRVAHHLIDVLDPHEEFSVAQYLAAAERVAAEINRRGRPALFVGGTPLYLKALLRGLFEGPPADWTLRHRLADEARAHGPDYLHGKLAEVDPPTAARLHPADMRRIIRALEVHTVTGQPISALQAQFERARPAAACRVFALEWPVDLLNRRIDERVDAMFAAGWVDEVRRLASDPRGMSRTAGQAVGYREIAEMLVGQRGRDETVALVKTRTRQFAKRQRTWFRSLSECRSVAMDECANSEDVAEAIAVEGARAQIPGAD